MTIRERLSDRLLKLLEHVRLGFEELAIISLRHDQRRFVRLLNDADTVIRRKGRDELDRFHMPNLLRKRYCFLALLYSILEAARYPRGAAPHSLMNSKMQLVSLQSPQMTTRRQRYSSA